jgi:transcription elongation GreA/GreB family factor
MSPVRPPIDLIKSHAERAAELESQREKQRSFELAEQRSELNSAEVRIRTWEKLHGLKMPTDPEHPVLDVIAVGTRLTLSEVQQEQRLRAERSGSSYGSGKNFRDTDAGQRALP